MPTKALTSNAIQPHERPMSVVQTSIDHCSDSDYCSQVDDSLTHFELDLRINQSFIVQISCLSIRTF